MQKYILKSEGFQVRDCSTWVQHRNKKRCVEEGRKGNLTLPMLPHPLNPGSSAWRETSSPWGRRMKHTFGRGLPQAPGQLPWPCAQDPVWRSQSLGSPQHQASPCNSKLQMDYCKPILQSCPAPVRFLQPQAHPSARQIPWASGSREPPYTSTLSSHHRLMLQAYPGRPKLQAP